MCDRDPSVRYQVLDSLCPVVKPLDSIVDEERLPTPTELPFDRLFDQVIVPAADERPHSTPILRRGGDQRQVSHAADGELQGSRDRRGTEGEHVDVRTQLLDALLVGHAEALLLVDD